MASISRRTFSSGAGPGRLRLAFSPQSRRSPAGHGRLGEPATVHSDGVAAPAGRAATGPLVVHIPDPRTGEVHLMVGTREVVRRDPALVARLVRDAG